MFVDRKQIIGVLLETFIVFFLSFSISDNSTYTAMATISIIQLITGLLCIIVFKGVGIISIPCIFSFLTWIFHCGQIVLKGYGLKGDIPLDITRYASYSNQVQAFRFYLFSQAAIIIGVLLFKSEHNKDEKPSKSIDGYYASKGLIIIGIIPRLYSDILRIVNSHKQGYKGVYSLYIPQFVSTLASFFDIGLGTILLIEKDTRKKKTLFWTVIIYKAIVMMTGARKENVGFLILWIFIYILSNDKIKIKEILTGGLMLVLGAVFVDAIGTTRSLSSFSVQNILQSIISNENSIVGDSLGEFGSAFCSLEVPFEQITDPSMYGYGKSYIAGFLSIIPLLVSQIPGLSSETTYVSRFSHTTFFGGSFIGEAYYNFVWLGLIVCFLTGHLAAYCHKYLLKVDNNNAIEIRRIMSITITISLLMFVRGYFTDMVQRIVWVFIFLQILQKSRGGFNESR